MDSIYEKAQSLREGKKRGLWDNIHAKRKRGERPAKPGEKDYPKTLNVEAKVDEKLPDYKRATARDKRYGNPHGSHELGGGIRKDRRADHENRRGVKEEEIPRGPGGKPIRIKDKIRAAKGQISNEGKPTVEMKEDKALAAVKASILKKHGKGAIYDPKKKQSSADKAKVAAERKKRQDADNKAYAARAKKAGFKSTQDYTDVVARYGSEDNYNKGKGLGT